MSDLVIATRGSKLALWQAEHIRARLEAAEPGLTVKLLVLKTIGDRVQDRPLSEVGGKGLFTKEIEDALLDGRAQVAVHSMKDLPAEGPQSPAELLVGAIPERADPRDALLLRPGLRGADLKDQPLAALPPQARVGTSSLRRLVLLRSLRPDLRIEPLRGNVDTRLRRLEAGELDAIVLAVAGLSRLGYGERIDVALPLALSLPAVGQGALAVQCRADDVRTKERLQRLDHSDTRDAVQAERAFLAQLEGNCRTPLAAHAEVSGSALHLRAWLAATPPELAAGGSFNAAETPLAFVQGERSGLRAQGPALGRELAEALRQALPAV